MKIILYLKIIVKDKVMKKFLKQNVYEETIRRLGQIFSKFDHIVVTFSGGKDSGVLLELVQKYY